MIDIQSLIFGIVLGGVTVWAIFFLLFRRGGIDLPDDYGDDAEQELWRAVNAAHDVTNRRAS